MTKFFTAALLSAALAFPMAAHAVTTISIGDSISEGQAFSDPLTFSYQATEDLRVLPVSLSATATSSGLDTVTFDVVRGSNTPLNGITWDILEGTNSAASAVLSTFVLLEDEFFTITFTGQPVNASNFTVSFDVAPVPLPAAGGMLLTAVVAGGIASRRKKKAT